MQFLSPMLLFVIGLLGADPESSIDGKGQSTADQRLRFAKRAAETYGFQFGLENKSRAKLQAEPLLRWNNQVIREDDGFLFLWTEAEKGRPVATAQFFLVESIWHHEFQSLSSDGFAATTHDDEGRGWNWHPTTAGLEFTTADKTEPALGSAAQRLRQMKSIVERFTAAVDTNASFESPEQLRLLTTPLYRYSSPDHNILDGAVFAFVQGTNPEILILVEAEGAGGTKNWRYGFARMSSFHLRVHRDGEVIWMKDRAPVPTPDATSPYFFRLRAQTDRSSELVVPALPK